MIIGLINLGLALELKARGRTSEAIKRLIGLQAKTARVIRDDKELDIAIEHVLLQRYRARTPWRKNSGGWSGCGGPYGDRRIHADG